MSKANNKIADEAIEFEDEDPLADLDVDESDVEWSSSNLHFKTLLFSFFVQRMYISPSSHLWGMGWGGIVCLCVRACVHVGLGGWEGGGGRRGRGRGIGWSRTTNFRQWCFLALKINYFLVHSKLGQLRYRESALENPHLTAFVNLMIRQSLN